MQTIGFILLLAFGLRTFWEAIKMRTEYKRTLNLEAHHMFVFCMVLGIICFGASLIVLTL